MGFVSHLIETIQYIRKHGWAEYRAARARYDRHTRSQDGRVTKRDKLDFRKQIKKMQKGK